MTLHFYELCHVSVINRG